MTATVYRAYTADGYWLLYVGCTTQLRNRISRHLCKAPWAAQDIIWTAVEYDTPAAALAAERHAIETEHPSENTAYRSRDRRAVSTVLSERPSNVVLVTNRADVRDLRRRRILGVSRAERLTLASRQSSLYWGGIEWLTPTMAATGSRVTA